MMNYFLHVESSLYDSSQVVVVRSSLVGCSIVYLVGIFSDFQVRHTYVNVKFCILLRADIVDVKISFCCFISNHEVFLMLKGLSFCQKIMALFFSFRRITYMEDLLLTYFQIKDSRKMIHDRQQMWRFFYVYDSALVVGVASSRTFML